MSLNDADLKYDRGRITPGILHFGVGQFCRAHLFYYTDLLLEISAKENHQYDSWGIVGVNISKSLRKYAMWKELKQQNCLYSLTMFPSRGSPTHMILGSMIEYLHAADQSDKVLQYLADPQIRIVSLTLSEGGYFINETTGQFDFSNDEIKTDLANPRNPKTTFGYIVEGLRIRREHNIQAFTVLCCDNLRHNGNVAKLAVVSYAKSIDSSLAKWIEDNVHFPSSMVDRITPATTPEIRARLNGITGLNDLQPVICEDFTQWALEDKFNARPQWERVGLELSDNVVGYETTKVRILNSSHILLAFPGLLLGYQTVHEALSDSDICQLVEDCLDNDVLPTLDSPIDKVQYKRRVVSRFMNAAVADPLTRISSDGCSKIQVFWTSSIIALLEQKRNLSNFAFGIACYIESLKGKDCNGQTYSILEPKLDQNWRALVKSEDLRTPLSLNTFDPWRSVEHSRLDDAIVKYRNLIMTTGIRNAIQSRNK